MNLAKQPASTIQILGAEKALFRALKTKHETPKYGLIYHASLIGQAPPKFKGKIARVLAAKCALSTRFDALGESPDAEIGLENRAKVRAQRCSTACRWATYVHSAQALSVASRWKLGCGSSRARPSRRVQLPWGCGQASKSTTPKPKEPLRPSTPTGKHTIQLQMWLPTATRTRSRRYGKQPA